MMNFFFRAIAVDNGERAVGDSFLFLAVLLVDEMLIRAKNNLLAARVVFSENLIDEGNEKHNAVIHHNHQ